ncbi:MAG: hypothetical protein IJX57_01840, partial [Clostridia bacterium]|nr:hypothetical protein [Clostridia bacterium]
MKNKRTLAMLMSMFMLISSFPSSVLAENAESDATFETMAVSVDKKYSSSVINTFRLQRSDFEIANLTDDEYESISVGREFNEKRSGSNTYMFNYDSAYPLSYSSYRSNTTHDATAWNQWMRWQLDSTEASLFAKLVATAGNIQVGGRYKGHIDTQALALAGKAYMGIEQKYNVGSSSTRIKYNETKMSGDEPKDTHVEKTIGFSDVASNVNTFHIQVGGTYGNTWGKNRNYAEVHYPQVFLKDNKKPTVKEIKVSGGYTSGEKTYFGNGDKVRVKLILSEPIRCVDNNYNSAFSISASGLSDFTAVEYNETDYTNAELHYEATVSDSTYSRVSGTFVADVNVVADKVTDLAGNEMKDSPNDFTSENIVIDGYLPRITKAEITSVFVKSEQGTEERKEQKNIIKSGDSIVFKIHYNQLLKESYSKTSVFPVKVGDEIYYAQAYNIYNGGSKVNFSGGSISDSVEFDSVEYILNVPTGVEEGVKITLPATKKNGRWVMDELGGSLENTYGNLSLDSSKRKTVQKETSIVAQDSENSIFEKTVDNTAPVITLTDEYGNVAEGVYATPEEADVKTAKSNKYKVYLKASETAQGSVKAELKYVPKKSPEAVTTIETKTQGAYTGDNVLTDMFVEFEIPETVLIDSTNHDVYIETTVYDEIYNKRVQKFYVSADTISPSVQITNGNGNGDLTVEGDVKYWKYQFDVTDDSSSEDMRIYYRFNSDTDYTFTDSSTNYTVKSSGVALDQNTSDTIYYYAVDGSGNESSVKVSNFYISDNRKCEIVDPEDVGKYIPSRDIYFTGFIAPADETVGTVYDYLVYSINSGEIRSIQNTDGQNVAIEASELSDDAIISYKLVRTTEDGISAELTSDGEWYSVIYHCDDIPPGIGSALSYDSSGNVIAAKVGAPYGTSHPKNIVSAKLILSNGTDEYEIDTSN